MRHSCLYIVIALLLAACAVAPERHGNLLAAEQDCHDALDAISAAQQANDRQLGGHAQRAKELIEQALSEMQLAAQAADQRGALQISIPAIPPIPSMVVRP